MTKKKNKVPFIGLQKVLIKHIGTKEQKIIQVRLSDD